MRGLRWPVFRAARYPDQVFRRPSLSRADVLVNTPDASGGGNGSDVSSNQRLPSVQRRPRVPALRVRWPNALTIDWRMGSATTGVECLGRFSGDTVSWSAAITGDLADALFNVLTLAQ